MDPNSKIGQAFEQGQRTVGQSVKLGANDVVSTATDQLVPAKTEEKTENNNNFLDELYAPSTENLEVKKQEIEARDRARIEELRKELHENYFSSLNTRPPKEERAKERVERMENEELAALEDKKPEEILPVGVAQKAQRVEKFPGTGG